MRGKYKQVTIIGCSVALRVRPPSVDRTVNKNYGQQLEDLLNSDRHEQWKVVNLGLSRALTSDILRMKDLIARENSDYIIINIGAVDAPSRDIPLWVADIIFQRNGRYFKPFVDYLYGIIKRNRLRRNLVFLRFGRSWTSHKKFKKQFEKILVFLFRNTSAEIIVMGINRGNARVENSLPGTLEKYRKYNDTLRKLSGKYRVTFIDFSDLESELYFPDGVHFNLEGHRMAAERILSIIP